jgi:small GTP-binding protein
MAQPSQTQASSLDNVIDAKVRDSIAGVSRSLERLSTILERMKADEEDLRQARKQGNHIGDLFLLVIVGEVKAGKSSFINALVGENVCKEGSIPTTDKVHILKYGEDRRERVLEDFLIEQTFPLEQLQAFNIVDTPGTNSLVEQHQKITEDFIPKCDMVLFTQSVDRPFSQTEREFLELIQKQWNRKVVFVLTKADQKSPSELDEIRKYVMDSTKRYFDFEPIIFTVSSKLAREGRERSDLSMIAASGFPQLEKWLKEKLNTSDRTSMKLASVIDAGLQICTRAATKLDNELVITGHDAETVEALDGKLTRVGKDLSEDYQKFIGMLSDVVYEVERKAHDWIDETVRIGNLGLLRNRESFRNAFQANVAGEIEPRIEEVLHKASDWFSRRTIKVIDDVTEYVDSRHKQGLNLQRQVGKVSIKYSYQRDTMFSRVREDARKAQEHFDPQGQVRRMSEGIASSIAMGTGMLITGTGVAALSAAIAGTMVMGVVGIVGGALLAVAAFALLPIKRGQLRRDFSTRCAKLKEELSEQLANQLAREVEDFVSGLREQMEPFTKEVVDTRERIKVWQQELQAVKTELLNFKNTVSPK